MFVSFLCASFFFSLLLLLLLLRVRVASRALGKRRSRFSNSLVTHPVESEQNAEEDARRRTNERANFDGFTRFFPSFLSLSLTLCPQRRFDAVLLLQVFSTSGKDKELVFDFDFD